MDGCQLFLGLKNAKYPHYSLAERLIVVLLFTNADSWQFCFCKDPSQGGWSRHGGTAN